MNSSFSSISFDAETAIKFKKFAKTLEKTHTELLNELLEGIQKIFPYSLREKK